MSEGAVSEQVEERVGGRPKVLVVEDEQGMLDIILEHLTLVGCEVIVARDGVQAWQAFEKERPDLVTLDLNIPKMSGFRLIKLFKQGQPGERSEVPVIVVTGMDYEEAEEVVVAGADDFITKPFDPGDLVEKVQAVLARRA